MLRNILLFVAAVLISACGGGSGGDSGGPQASAPGNTLEVKSVFPKDSATGVALNSKIQLTLSEVPDPFSIIPGNFVVTQVGNAVAINLAINPPSMSGRVVSITFVENFQPQKVIEVKIAGVKGMSGNQMVAPFESSFTTGNSLDAIPPSVATVAPLILPSALLLMSR
jgi:Bacterial Ig-like domain